MSGRGSHPMRDANTVGMQRMEIIELADESHPYFVAAQFHPELKSRVMVPSPLFFGLLRTGKGPRGPRAEGRSFEN